MRVLAHFYDQGKAEDKFESTGLTWEWKKHKWKYDKFFLKGKLSVRIALFNRGCIVK